MRFDIVTVFPDFFTGPFDHGILKRALLSGLAEVVTHDLRAFTHDRHKTVDDRPFGGGEGMILKIQPIAEAIHSIGIADKGCRSATSETVILLSAHGRPFTQAMAQELAGIERVVFLCGRYEGIDERVREIFADREVSIGDYVLSGGELAAAVMIDAIVRLLPGALGNPDSARFESFGGGDAALEHRLASPQATHGAGGLLDYPHYTRPADYAGHHVPTVLQGGDHAAIRQWRRQRSLEKTLRMRPDLLQGAELSAEDRAYLRTLADAP